MLYHVKTSEFEENITRRKPIHLERKYHMEQLDKLRETDKRLRKEAKENGGRYQSEQEIEIARRKAEKHNAVNNLYGIDRRKYSIQNVDEHRKLGNFIPHDVKGLLLVMATLLETKGKGSVTNRKYVKLGISEIADKIGKHRNHISPILDRMVNEFRLAYESIEGKSKVYELDSRFYACGKQKGANNFVRMYQEELLRVSKQFNLVELGFLADLLNYMHPRHHILLKDPSEVHEADMEILRGKDIAEMFNMQTSEVNRYIRKLILKEVLIRMEIGNGRSIAKVLIVSPTFFSKTSKLVDFDIIKSIVVDTTLCKKNYIV